MVTRQRFLRRTESREREGRTHMQAEPWNEGFRGKCATWKKKRPKLAEIRSGQSGCWPRRELKGQRAVVKKQGATDVFSSKM